MRRRFVLGPFAIRSFQFFRLKRNGLLAGWKPKSGVQNRAPLQTGLDLEIRRPWREFSHGALPARAGRSPLFFRSPRNWCCSIPQRVRLSRASIAVATPTTSFSTANGSASTLAVVTGRPTSLSATRMGSEQSVAFEHPTEPEHPSLCRSWTGSLSLCVPRSPCCRLLFSYFGRLRERKVLRRSLENLPKLCVKNHVLLHLWVKRHAAYESDFDAEDAAF